MKKLIILKNHWWETSIVIILLFATILRFVNYENRWGLAYDQAHDVLVARYAVESGKLPLLGPFSSAGPFQTGGEWYWFIMAGVYLAPQFLIMPWVMMTILYIFFVLLIIKVGTELMDKKFGIIVGLLATVSSAQIAQGTNLTNQSPLAITSLLALWFMIQFVRTKKLLFAFFLGFFVSLSGVIHLQGVSLIVLIFVTLLFGGVINKKSILILFFGLLVPTIPILVFDLQNDLLNIRGMIQYYLFDQYKVSLDVLGRRWFTYAFVFWPKIWADVIGGFFWIGYIIILIVSGTVLSQFIKRKISIEWKIIVISFVCIGFILRYIRTPIFESYLVFLHPFVLLITAFGIYQMYKKIRWIGVYFLIFIMILSLINVVNHIQKSENISAKVASIQTQFLIKNFPKKKFAVYAYKHKWVDKNIALSLFLESQNLIDDAGHRIGIVVATHSGEFKYPALLGREKEYQILDFQESSAAALAQHEYVRLNPRDIYLATQEWYNKK